MSTTAPAPSSTTQAPSGSSLSSQSSSTSSPVPSTDESSTPPPASSSSSQSSSSSSTSSSSTTTSRTTQPSNPPQTTLPVESTTPAYAASSFASTPAITSTSSFTSQVATTFSTTDPGGSVVYITTAVPQIIATSISSGSSHSSSSNTGIIAGAVVGGVTGIALLALLIFCIRKRVRDDEFDGNFDPDYIVGHTNVGGGTLPNVNLADEVSPFPHAQSYTDQGSASMRQYGNSQYMPVASSLGPSGQPSVGFYPPGSAGMGVAAGAGASIGDAQHGMFMQPGTGPPPPGAYAPPINMYGMDWDSPRPGASPPASTVSNYTTSTRLTKEREAMGRGGQGAGLGLTTQPEVAEGSGDVVVHQDAGRAPIEEHVPPREIPPSYDSIRQD